MHNITVTYQQTGPKFTDNSRQDDRIDFARFGELKFFKVFQNADNNIELSIGGNHKKRSGDVNLEFNSKGNVIKRKRDVKRIKVNVKRSPELPDGRKYTIYRGMDTDSDSSDEDYRLPTSEQKGENNVVDLSCDSE